MMGGLGEVSKGGWPASARPGEPHKLPAEIAAEPLLRGHTGISGKEN